MKPLISLILIILSYTSFAQSRSITLASKSTISSTSIIQSVFDKDGGILHFGRSEPFSSHFLCKTSREGILQYSFEHWGAEGGIFKFTQNGDYYIENGQGLLGRVSSIFDDSVKFWSHSFNINGNKRTTAICELPRNGISVCGINRFATSFEGQSGYIIKLDTTYIGGFWAKKYSNKTIDGQSNLWMNGLLYINKHFYTSVIAKEVNDPKIYVALMQLDSNGVIKNSYRLDTAGMLNGEYYFFSGIQNLTQKGDSIIFSSLCNNGLTDTNYHEAIFVGKFNLQNQTIKGLLFGLPNYNKMNVTCVNIDDTNYQAFAFMPSTEKANPNNYLYLLKKSFFTIVLNDTIKYSKRILSDTMQTVNSVLYNNDTAFLSGMFAKRQTGYFSYFKLSDTSTDCNSTDTVLLYSNHEQQLSTNGYRPDIYNINFNTRTMYSSLPGYPYGDSTIYIQYACGDTLPTIPVTISQNQLLHSIKVYPNPTNGVINIDGSTANIRKVILQDITGRILKELYFNHRSITVNTSSIFNHTGIIFCTVQTDTDIYTERVVINSQ
ncbi:MAG TPA: T9SS type A sorting domain-containing protein [Flavipsychrobacter sp.]|nr:T9SS type A sorting domain-containing protein [Flavipsychrobacter sp.]